jgi:tetratricopeptide (TPR) repeat protein/predicted Ser/Thr protein kinase
MLSPDPKTIRLEAPPADVNQEPEAASLGEPPGTNRSAIEAEHLSRPSQSGHTLERGDRVDRYVILKTVGEGGMGVVYAAYDPELDRKVALKLLRTDSEAPDQSDGRARMLREAKAMARVSHPNVCAVHDAGTLGRQIFIAMEFVDGSTLHDLLDGPPRPWRELLRIFIDAGQGLAAAHDAGLVHRDFKPGNVLLGKGDRALVTDFGLARLMTAAEDPRSLPESVGYAPGTEPALDTAVTQVGVVVGTPSYMPPEQYLGIPPDARSDQFAFCATLYWALYRKRPFNPKQIYEAARKMAHPDGTAALAPDPKLPPGIIQEPPPGSEVPTWVRRVLMRGLSLHPRDRFPSMRDLLEELSQEPRRVRQRQMIAGAGMTLAVLVGAGVGLLRREPVCEGAEQQMAQVWNKELQGKLEAAFTATGKPFAREVAQSVGRVLDTYSRDWARQHTEACVATRVRGVQTEQLLSLQVVCLERRRKELGAMVRLFTTADGRLVTRSVDVVNALPSLQECQDVESLSSQQGLPADPTRREQVEQLADTLAEIKTLGRAGRYEESVRRATELEPQVTAAGYLPLQAELHSTLGWNQQLMGKAEEGAKHIEQAVNDAEMARADRLKAHALTQLLFVRGMQGLPEQAAQWARLAESAIARLGGDVELAARLKGNLGNVALRQGRYAEAQRYFEETRKLEETALPVDHHRRIRTTYNLGLAALNIGEYKQAAELLNEALGRMEASLGGQHPEVALCHAMLSWALSESGDPQQGLRHAESAVAIRKAAFGEEHPAVAEGLDAVGMTLIKLRRYDEARQTFEKAVAMKEKTLGPDSADLSFSYDGIGQALLAAGRPQEAITPLKKSLSFEGGEPEPLAVSGFALARALMESGQDPAGALAAARTARERFVQVDKKERVAEVDAWLQTHAQPAKASFKPQHKP